MQKYNASKSSCIYYDTRCEHSVVMWLQLSCLVQATEEVDMMRLEDEGFTMSHWDVLPNFGAQ